MPQAMPILRQFAGFIGVGVFGLVAHYTVLTALVELGGVEAVAASIVGFVAGGVVNYVLNRKLVFRSERAHSAAGPRFVAVAVSGLAINAVAMAVLVDRLGVYYLVAQVLVTGGLTAWHFLLNRFWTFRA